VVVVVVLEEGTSRGRLLKRDVAYDSNEEQVSEEGCQYTTMGRNPACLRGAGINEQASIAQTSDRAGDLRCKLRYRCKTAFE